MAATPPIGPELAVELVAAWPDGVVIVDRAGRIAHANPAAETLLGRIAAGGPVAALACDAAEAERLAVTTGPTAYGLRTAAGERRMCLVRGLDVAGQRALILRDGTSVSDPLEQSARSEASFRALVESAPDAVVVHQDNRVVYANRRLREAWGGPPDELIGLDVTRLIHPDDLPRVLERQRGLAAGDTIAPFTDERLVRHDGSPWIAHVAAVNFVYQGKPSVLVVARDVTELRSMQTRFAQADRMVALGTLAAGVAHEIGNPLTYVLLRLDAAALRTTELRRALPPDRLDLAALADELAGHTAAVIDGARRVRAIVSELKAFAHVEPDTEPQPIDVVAPLERALTMAAHEMKGRRLTRELAPAAPVLAADGKLTQVFLNLVLNAVHATRDAPPAGGAHEIAVRVRGEGAHTVVEIADTGSGIAPADLPRVFDPFFSTKSPGEGAGLGLAICQSIISGFGGQIRVASQPGAGSTFTVVLPAALAS